MVLIPLPANPPPTLSPKNSVPTSLLSYLISIFTLRKLLAPERLTIKVSRGTNP